MTEPVDRALRRLTRALGVRGAMVVDAEAGVSVAAELTDGLEEQALAAMTGSLFRRTVDASRSSGFGEVRLLQLDTGSGHLVVAGAGALLVVALTEPEVQLGLVRVETERAAAELGE